KYIELMQELQLELAGEYLVMAATLAEIKSRMLLPRPKAEQGAEEDPRAELVRRLQEYERFKRAAAEIDSLPRLERDGWPTSREPRAGLARGSWPRCGARGRRPARTARRTGSPMSDSYLRNVIEAALLAAGAPLPVAELTRLFDESARPSVQQVRAVVAALAEE